MADDPGTPLLPPAERAGPKPTGWYQQRYVFACLSFLGLFNVYVLRVNLSVAMVAMVNTTTGNGNTTNVQECPVDNTTNSSSADTLHGEFDWSPSTQGIILSSFFYGYLVTQLPGGLISEKIGGKWPFGVGVFMTGALTLLTPLAARTNVYLLIAVRVLEGVGEGVTFPAFQSLAGRWAPPLERSLIFTSFIGCQVGTVVSMPLTAWLSETLGWPYAFYICGAVSCAWFVFWAALVFNSPDDHPRISEEERKYITTAIGDHSTKRTDPIPWKGILTSAPVWSIALAHTGVAYLFYTLLIDLPTYMKTVMHFNLNEDGLFSALPYLAYTILTLVYNPFADWLLTKGHMRTTTIRKLSTALGMFIPSAFMIGTAWIGCDYMLGVTLLTISCATQGLNLAGYMPNCVDIAPRYSGTIFGLVNTFGTITGIVAPLVVGALTKNNQTQEQWRYIFFIAGGFCACSAIPYIIFAKAERAPWSYGQDEKPLITQSINQERSRLLTIKKEKENNVDVA
ncbi:sialin-like [Lineus longissimus]|uniref:sialin-like n=1 Tax=Lineus longissimus TaxID=88925 RepID=UPI002B4CB36C